MTAQINDIYRYKRRKYFLVALSAGRLFDPKDYGMESHPRISACWRGYWCEYAIKDTGILLKHLFLFNKDGNYSSLNGKEVSPQTYNEYESCGGEKVLIPAYFGHRLYKNLNMPIPYTGKVLLGRGFLDDYYVHMGFQRAWAYKELREFVFENGILMKCNDLSHIAETQRETMKQQKINPRYPYDDDIEKFVNDSFSLDYPDKTWWLEE